MKLSYYNRVWGLQTPSVKICPLRIGVGDDENSQFGGKYTCMSAKQKNPDLEIIGYKEFKTSLPKPKKKKSKKPMKLKFGELYDPTPEDFGKQYNPMEENPSGVSESFADYFLLSLQKISQ